MTIDGGRVAGFGRLEDGLKPASPWYTWGPYVSERQWGTEHWWYPDAGRYWVTEVTYAKSDDMLYPGNQS